jgi:hypothetical protein
MLRSALILVVALALSSDAAAQSDPERNIIVAQPDAPVQIVNYASAYYTSDRYTSEGIHHTVESSNRSGKQLVAMEMGLVSFSVFNDFLDRNYGHTGRFDRKFQEGAKSERSTWVGRAGGEHTHFTGVAWVNRVRFTDGSIWKANQDEVVAVLRKIQSDFDAKDLERSKEPPPTR